MEVGPAEEPDDVRAAAVERTAWTTQARTTEQDLVAWEEPLEIRLRGVALAVVMRTPGHDEELTLGFLVTERVVERADQVISVQHCDTVEHPEAEGNVILARLAPETEVDLARLRRNLYASSSCGICGKATLENALSVAPPLDDPVYVSRRTLLSLPGALRSAQDVFSRTGGLHAAGLFTCEGKMLVVREDVGRHNAVDKVIGWALRANRLPLREHVLMVSGRISYEIVQKALAARIPVLAAVSAPSSLAIDLGRAGNLTVAAFVRDDRLCIYAGAQRITD